MVMQREEDVDLDGEEGKKRKQISTLVQALFRWASIDLRSRFGIISQEPVLFEVTIRSNIDPIGQYSDAEIWQVWCH